MVQYFVGEPKRAHPPMHGAPLPGNVHYLCINEHGKLIERSLIIENGLE